jgi:hypothetical protein
LPRRAITRRSAHLQGPGPRHGWWVRDGCGMRERRGRSAAIAAGLGFWPSLLRSEPWISFREPSRPESGRAHRSGTP